MRTHLMPFRKSGGRNLLAALILLPAVQAAGAGDGSLQDQLGNLIDIVVAQDGTGDYTKVQDAIDAAPDSSSGISTVIFIRNGVYHEKLIVPNEKPNLTLIGEDVDSTILTYNDRSLLTVDLNTFASHSVRVDASDVRFLNLTIQNPETASQAVALHGNGDRQTFAHCRILGWQDTYYSDMRSRNYFRDCFIAGRTDFIFGFGVALFDSCQIPPPRPATTISGWCSGTAGSTRPRAPGIMSWEGPGSIMPGPSCWTATSPPNYPPPAGTSGLQEGIPPAFMRNTIVSVPGQIPPGGWPGATSSAMRKPWNIRPGTFSARPISLPATTIT
jgi:hypothetical protein